MNINSITVVVLKTNWRISQSKSKKTKTKKIHPEKNYWYFQKWNLLALILKKFLHFVKRKLLLHFLKRTFFLYFLIFQEASSPPPLAKIFILEETETLKSFLKCRQMYHLSLSPRPPKKIWCIVKRISYPLGHSSS